MPLPDIMHQPAAPSICADCGAETGGPSRPSSVPVEHVPNGPPVAIGTGYATLPSGARVCYPCADARQRADLADPSTTVYTGYVSADGARLTSWTGGTLARIIWTKKGARDYRRNLSPCAISYRIETPDGRRWHGRGSGPGMCLTVRLMRGGAR